MTRFDKILLGLLIITFFVFLYLLSVGHFDPKNLNLAKEFQESRQKARLRNNQLKVILRSTEALKKDLEIKFKRYKLLFRSLLVAIWILGFLPFYWIGVINTFSGFATYLGISGFSWTVLLFLSAGGKNHLKEFIEMFEMRLQNWVYGKYIAIDEDINTIKNEMKALKPKIE